MPKPYSGDLRARVIEEIETGASRREAAERYGISASVVVIWAQRFEKTGSVAAKPSGGSTSPLAGSRSAVWRFFDRRNISFKKNSVRDGAKARRRGPRAPALDARARHV